jgi:hypothetical protein
MARPIRDIETARDRLADALWWLRGFSAAAVAGPDEVADRLATEISEVREYLNEMQRGSVRRLGDEQAIVLSYAEFEHLVDAARPGAAREDLSLASTTIHKVLAEYAAEKQRANDDKFPF